MNEHDVFFVPSQFRTIQAAIDAVTNPATIMIEPGVYAECVSVSGISSLVMQSTRLSRRGVVIRGSDGESAIEVSASKVYLSGIEVRTGLRMRGIEASDSTISLQECVIAGNAGGMRCRNSMVRVQKSIVAGNAVDDCGAGLHFTDCRVEIAGSSIQTNEVHASEIARGGGIWCERSQLRLWRSRVTENWLDAPLCEGGGCYFSDMTSAHLGGSVISGNHDGGGLFVRSAPEDIRIYPNTSVRQNHPEDVHFETLE